MAKSTKERVQSRRAQRQKQQQQTRLIIAVVVIAVVAVAAVVLLTRPQQVTTAVETNYEGLQQSVVENETGIGFAIGDPNAPVTLTDFSDFSCPHCYNLSTPVEQLIDDYVRSGDLRVVFKPVSFVNPPYSEPAARAAVCAGYQDKFWEMQAQIWALYEASGPGAYTAGQLNNLAESIGLDMQQYNQCYGATATAEAVQSVITEAGERGVTGTPTLFVNGQQVPYRGEDTVYNDLSFIIEEQTSGS